MKTAAGTRFAGKLDRLMRSIESAAVDGVAAADEVLADSARGFAPRRTGGLAAAIEPSAVTRTGDVVSGTVDCKHPGVASVEYGDRDQAAEPFLRPGFDAARDQARDAVADSIRRAL